MQSTIPRLTLGLSINIWILGLALIRRSHNHKSGYSNSDVEKDSTPNLPENMKPTGPLSFLILLVERFREKRFHKFIRKFFIVVLLAVQNSLLFRDGSLEVVGIVRFVRIQSIRAVNLPIVDVHFHIGKN